jgi:hypothetical protein
VQVSVAETGVYFIFLKQTELQSIFNHKALFYKTITHFITTNFGTSVAVFLVSSTTDET